MPIWARWLAGMGIVLLIAANFAFDYYYPRGFLIDAVIVVYLIVRYDKL
ncbi:MAG TPA: hypothetical protein VKB26_07665 [Candidatus Acidoferrales bacterium]|nr:hypothetical protein [Candidatus Acidoferrales bacterium]